MDFRKGFIVDLLWLALVVVDPLDFGEVVKELAQRFSRRLAVKAFEVQHRGGHLLLFEESLLGFVPLLLLTSNNKKQHQIKLEL